MQIIFAVSVGIVAISACTPAESNDAVEVSAIAGVTTVDNHEPKWERGESWSVSSEPEVSIGVLDGPAAYQLFGVSSAARQSDGDFVVIDRGTREVRLYDRHGTFVRTLGGPGSGPGEFLDPAQVVVTAGDSVVVWDDANYRITRFDRAGKLVNVQSIDRGRIAKAIDPPLYPNTAMLLSDGQILVRLIEKTGESSPVGFRSRSGALMVSADLSRIDTLMLFGGIEQITVRAPWGQMPVVPPVAKRTVIAVQTSLGRVCIGDQEGPEIVCFNDDASRTVIRWSADAAPATELDVTVWRDTILALYTQKMSEVEALRMLEEVTVPTVRPHYASIVLDQVGNLWVEQGRTNGSASGSVDHLVFDRNGTLLGVVDLPPIAVLEIGDDYIMGIHKDELGVEYLRVYRIVKPASTDSP